MWLTLGQLRPDFEATCLTLNRLVADWGADFGPAWGQLEAVLGLDLGSDAPPDKPWLIRGRIVVDFGPTLKELG